MPYSVSRVSRCLERESKRGPEMRMPPVFRNCHLFFTIAVLACLVFTERSYAESSKGVVVTVSPPAAQVGARVLGAGGNAIDAAVAMAFALAVTYPEAGNIGGGGYLLYSAPSSDEAMAFDFREVAPGAATRDMFVRDEDRTGHRRVGVPGTVAGLALAHEKLGKLPWRDLVMPAVQLAQKGFVLNEADARSLNDGVAKATVLEMKEFLRVYAPPTGGKWRAWERLIQPDLARTLQRIADQGPAGFYAGETAALIVEEMQRGGGLITREDLNDYRALTREPLRGSYRGVGILAMPPSSSGGTTLIEALNILECFDLAADNRFSVRTIHLMAESMKRAYRDRAAYLGDPDFVSIPSRLLDKAYARQLADTIDLERATPSVSLAGDIPIAPEGDHTTHLSVVDGEGAAVSLTYTLEARFGGAVVVTGGGFLLNDEMNDFAWVPGRTDTQGRIGTTPNQIEPGKRMLSSMCPIILTKDNKPYLVTGSPGGRTIINTVLCVVVNVVDFTMQPRAAVVAPRMHHAWFPDQILLEESPQYPASLLESLRKMGHDIRMQPRQGDAHTIWIDPMTGNAGGIADPRIAGKALSPE